MRDDRGLEVSTDSPDVLAALHRFRTELLSIGPGAGDVIAAADAHPGSFPLEACAAACGLFAQTPEGDALTATHLARADGLASAANPRERRFLEAVRQLAARRHALAADTLEALLEAHPTDLVAAKLLEFDYYLMGQQHSGPRFLATMDRIAEANQGDGLFQSMHSFALELTGRYATAIEVAESALSAVPVNPWADHTLAHALLKTGRIDDGIAAAERHRASWDTRAPFIRAHNSWHLALMHLEQLDRAGAYRVVDEAILSDETPLLVQAMDVISLLWRIEMAGGEVPDADWQRLADMAAPEAAGAYCAFQSAHLHFALARAGREAELAAARQAIEADVPGLAPPEQGVWLQVGLPLLSGVTAYARGDHAGAARHLEPLFTALPAVGGSDAQVDLFRQTLVLALLGAGRGADALAVLEASATSPVVTPLQAHWRAMC